MDLRLVFGALLALTSLKLAAVEVADYRFQNSYASSISSAPDLVPTGAGLVFTADNLNGVARTVLAFPAGVGVSLTTTGLIANNTYSVAMLVRIADAVGWCKYMDVANGLLDDGLYNHHGMVKYLTGFSSEPLVPITSGGYHQVVLTRSSAGALIAYVDGVQMFSATDDLDIAVIDPGFDVIRFMTDDDQTAGDPEIEPGAIARIRIWNHVLTPAEVAALEKVNPSMFKDGFE